MILKSKNKLLFFRLFDIIIVGDTMKGNEDVKKKDRAGFWYAFLAIITLIVAIIGATYAFILVKGQNDNNDVIVKAGTLSVKYIDGRVINNPKLIPRNKPVNINDIVNAYKKEFVVQSDGSLDQYVTIYFNVEKNEFSNNNLKYVIYEDNKEIKNGYINGMGEIKIVEGSYLESAKSHKYTMIIWIDENGQNQDSQKNKNISGSFIIDAIQYND